MVDHYEVLGISETASLSEIKKAYRNLMLRYHPDRNHDNSAAAHEMTIAINLAYEILSGPKRSEYDIIKKHRRSSTSASWTASQQHAYENAERKYQESEDEARERIREWFYARLNIQPQKKYRSYEPHNDETALGGLIASIDSQLGDKAWEYRITAMPDSPERINYNIRIVCDPTKCGFREQHHHWVKDYFYGIFKPGTPIDAEYNIRLAYTWLGKILEEKTTSHQITVFFGVTGDSRSPWRCYLDVTAIMTVSAFDVFFQRSMPSLSKLAKDNKKEVAAIFNKLAMDIKVSPKDLWQNDTMRKSLARQAENVLRSRLGMRRLDERN